MNLMEAMDFCMDSEFLSSTNKSADDIQCILDDIIQDQWIVMKPPPPNVTSTNEEEKAVQNDNNEQLINTETTAICLHLTRTVKNIRK